MPVFIVIGHRVCTDGKFTLNDLAGSTGRLDVLLRCVNSAFMLSNDIRRDMELFLVLLGEPDPPRTLRFVGSELKYLNPDERSTGALVKNALMKTVDDEEVGSTPGIYVSRDGLALVLKKLVGRKMFYLKEDGESIRNVELDSDGVFILGGQDDLASDEENMVKASGDAVRVSLGPKSLHADHCMTVVLNALDNAS
jgi:tRNA (pseudouridine54-N1)-methyltransferase